MRLWAMIFAVFASASMAEPVAYRLDGTASRIEFTFDLEGLPLSGRVPITTADVIVDFDNLAQSRVGVTMHVARATTRFGIATEAMRLPSMLNTAVYPMAQFHSRRVTRLGDGARLEGDLTLRGVTRPVTLEGAIFRRRGSLPGDLSDLVLIFEGTLDRHDFGASGYHHLVAEIVALRVLVAIVRE